MKSQVSELIKQKGYDPIFQSINATAKDMQRTQYTKQEVRQTLFEYFGTENEIITKRIIEVTK